MALDRIDMKILRALQNDARLSNKELAGIVGLAPSSCLERVRRLRKEKILLGSHARIEPSAVGIGLQAMIAVQLGQHSRDIVQRFRTLPNRQRCPMETVAHYCVWLEARS